MIHAMSSSSSQPAQAPSESQPLQSPSEPSATEKLRYCLSSAAGAQHLETKSTSLHIEENVDFLRTLSDYDLMENAGLGVEGTHLARYHGKLGEFLGNGKLDRERLSKHVYDKFIKDDSGPRFSDTSVLSSGLPVLKGNSSTINISSEERNALTEKFESGQPLLPSDFAAARSTIEQLLLRDAKPKALIEDHYKFMKQMESSEKALFQKSKGFFSRSVDEKRWERTSADHRADLFKKDLRH